MDRRDMWLNRLSTRCVGSPPRTFRLTDEDVSPEELEPGWYWVLNVDTEGLVEVVVNSDDVHGVYVEGDFTPAASLDPESWSAWAGPLPSPGWDSQFPELNSGETDPPPYAEARADLDAMAALLWRCRAVITESDPHGMFDRLVRDVDEILEKTPGPTKGWR